MTVLKVATYNVHYWQNPEENKYTFVDVIENIRISDCDIIGLQEVLIQGKKYKKKIRSALHMKNCALN